MDQRNLKRISTFLVLLCISTSVIAAERKGQRVYVTGILREHVGADKSAPFALADPHGRIRYIVTADQGVPLDLYLHNRIALRGRVHYGEYAHLTVDEIVEGASDPPRRPRAPTAAKKQNSPSKVLAVPEDDNKPVTSVHGNQGDVLLGYSVDHSSELDEEESTVMSVELDTELEDTMGPPPSLDELVVTSGTSHDDHHGGWLDDLVVTNGSDHDDNHGTLPDDLVVNNASDHDDIHATLSDDLVVNNASEHDDIHATLPDDLVVNNASESGDNSGISLDDLVVTGASETVDSSGISLEDLVVTSANDVYHSSENSLDDLGDISGCDCGTCSEASLNDVVVTSGSESSEASLDDEDCSVGFDDSIAYGDSCDGGGDPSCCTSLLWIRGEYLHWWADGMDVPPLVTTSGTVQELPLPTGQILFGNESILKDDRSGIRFRFGTWLDECSRFGLEGEYLRLQNTSSTFRAASDAAGNPILGRPFTAMNPRDASVTQNPARAAAELISAPAILSGSVQVAAESDFDSAGFRGRINLCSCLHCGCAPCGCRGATSSRVDLVVGYRHTGLDESLSIREDLSSLDPNDLGDFGIVDRFDTRNDFHGAEIGIQWEMARDCWSLEFLGKLALGNNRQRVTINGQTVITGSSADDGTYTGGLLAQSSNIGQYERDDFSVVPELGVTLGYQLTCRLRFVLGYSFIYWSRVIRPGDQMDLDVNEDYLPPMFESFDGPSRPEFAFRDTDFWVQGFNLGMDLTW